MNLNPLSDGDLYSHWTDVLDMPWPWPNFTPSELASKREGEFYWHSRSITALQAARTRLGQPMYINSAHRSWLHNIAVGGSARSYHRFIAFDISLAGFRDKLRVLYRVLRDVGFKGFGFYLNFLHVDLGRARMFFASDEAKAYWSPVLSGPQIDVAL